MSKIISDLQKKNIGIIICSVLMLVCLLGLAYEAGEESTYRSMLKEKKEALANVEAEIEDIMYTWAFGSDWGTQTPIEHMESWNTRHGDIFLAYGTDTLYVFYNDIKKAYDERLQTVTLINVKQSMKPYPNKGYFDRGYMIKFFYLGDVECQKQSQSDISM